MHMCCAVLCCGAMSLHSLQARHRNPKSPELWLAAIRTEQQAGSIKAAEALLAKGLQVSCQTAAAQPGAIKHIGFNQLDVAVWR